MIMRFLSAGGSDAAISDLTSTGAVRHWTNNVTATHAATAAVRQTVLSADLIAVFPAE